MPQRQYYNVDPTLPQRDSKFNLLYTMDVVKLSKRCCNIEITTSYSKFLHNIDSETSRSQRRTNVASTLDSKFTLKYNIGATVTISILYSHCDVKFTSFWRRYYNFAPTLRQLCKEPQILTNPVGKKLFPLLCIKITKLIIKNMRFIWYADSL